jgi:hypothetical protein
VCLRPSIRCLLYDCTDNSQTATQLSWPARSRSSATVAVSLLSPRGGSMLCAAFRTGRLLETTRQTRARRARRLGQSQVLSGKAKCICFSQVRPVRTGCCSSWHGDPKTTAGPASPRRPGTATGKVQEQLFSLLPLHLFPSSNSSSIRFPW